MYRNTHQFTHATARAVATAMLVATIAFVSGPAIADKAAATAATSEDRVETRIADMHANLKITAAQEELWAKVAQAMRDDAKTMDGLTQARADHAKTMTAIEDLKSYGEIAQAHADNTRKFSSVFETLYAGMSDAQKSGADELFRHGKHNSKMNKMSKSE